MQRALPQLDLPSLRKKQQEPRARWLALTQLDGAVVAAMRRPLWAISMWIAAAFAVLPPLAFFANAHAHDGIAVVLKQEMNKSGRLDKVPPEQRAQVDQVLTPIMVVALPLGAAAKRQIWILYCALVCLALLQGTRPQLTARNIVAVACVGAAPWFVYDVVSAAVLASFDIGTIDPQNPVASNPASWLFAGKDTRTPLAAALRGVDFFELWGCVWMTAALTRAAGGRTSVPAVVVFGGHIAATLKDAASAAAASS